LTAGGWIERFFSLRYLRWLGNMSYSFYLMHNLPLSSLFRHFAPTLATFGHGELLFWLLMPMCFLLSTGASFLVFIAIEKPLSFPRPEPALALGLR
jgi:peptidoglycan/LPS O-acetylase OafA/YrhL